MPATLAILLCATLAQDPWPQTRAERSNYAETSRYADVVQFLHTLQQNGAPIRITSMGKSTEGRDMPLVVASRPLMTPQQAARSGRPILYIQGNIHAGEVEGKEASLHLLRKWCQEKNGVLDRAVVLVAPIYNADGNEKFGPVARNRPGQDGPAEVGVRPNGQGLDLNRDCMKARSPEMQGVLRHVYGTWDPHVVIDLHTTNGTRHGYELTYSSPLNPNTDPGILRFSRDELMPRVRRTLRQRQRMETFDYGNAQRNAWHTFGEEGRYVTNYAGLRGRIGVLSEATTYLSFKDRVVATERFVQATVDELLRNSKRVVELCRQADARPLPKELGVRFEAASRGDEEVLLERPQQPRPTGRPKDLVKVKMPIYDRFRAARSATVPAAYVFPAEETEALALLQRHGIQVERLAGDATVNAERFLVGEVVQSNQPFQGGRLVRLEGAFKPSTETLPAGSLLVRTAQPLGVLAFQLLEPEGLDGVVAWEFLKTLPEVGKPFPILKLNRVPAMATVVVD